jgi:hypothetical protein
VKEYKGVKNQRMLDGDLVALNDVPKRNMMEANMR